MKELQDLEEKNKNAEVIPDDLQKNTDEEHSSDNENTEQSEEITKIGFFAQKKDTLISFLKYPRLIDLRSALYSIFFMVSASWWFSKIPKLPFTALVLIPFLYLSIIGATLVFTGMALEQSFTESKFKILRKFFGMGGSISKFCRRDGERFLHAGFGVGLFMLASSLYYAFNDNKLIAWLLLPLILLVMVTQFSLSQHAKQGGSTKGLLKMILHRAPYIIAMVTAMYGIYYILSGTLKNIVPV